MMIAFDQFFPHVARTETRAFTTSQANGSSETFLLRERYCGGVGCDCRRVVFFLQSVEHSDIVATISHFFDASTRRDEPQTELDPDGPQSKQSKGLLALFKDVIRKEAEWRDRLEQHYSMFKRAIDDAARPAKRARKPRPQPAPTGTVGLVVAKVERADGKLQQKFRRLLEKVERLRDHVRGWKDQRPNIDREIAIYAAALDRQATVARELISLLDQAHATAKLTKVQRAHLALTIVDLAGMLLDRGGHDDLKPLYNRHNRRDFDAEAAEAEADSVAVLKEMLESFGIDLGDEDVSSMERLRELAGQEKQALEAEAQASESRRAQRKKSAKQLAAETRRAVEQRDVEKSVQDIYRTLAKAWHPDREPDPAERDRKAVLMRDANAAYEANDLLGLLELQLRLEGIDETAATIAEERVHHYIKILDDQARQLATELESLELPFRVQMNLSPRAALSPHHVIAQVRQDVTTIDAQTASLRADLSKLREPSQLKPWLQRREREACAWDGNP